MRSSHVLKGVILLLISATSLSAVAFADPPNAQFENKYVFVTGSMIGTATVSPLRVIKHREIYQSGRYTTEGVMKVEDPSLQVISGRAGSGN